MTCTNGCKEPVMMMVTNNAMVRAQPCVVESCLTSDCLANIACYPVVVETTTPAVLLQLCIKVFVISFLLFPSVTSFVELIICVNDCLCVCLCRECSDIVSV